MKKVILVSSVLPETNYSQYLARFLYGAGVDLVVFADKNVQNKNVQNCGKVRLVWNKKPRFFTQILKSLRNENYDIIHFQHEINMFGSPLTAILLPLLIMYLKLHGKKIVITIHGVAEKKQINKDFICSFLGDKKLPSFLVRIVFIFIYTIVGKFSDQMIVHTKLIKKILIKDYGVDENKINIIRHGVPNLKTYKKDSNAADYFLYFGYIVKRKGLDNLIKGYSKYVLSTKNPINLVLAGGVIKGQEFALEEIKELIKEFNLQKHVFITGFLELDQIEYYFKNARAIMIPSKISIAASGPLAQAFSFGKCIAISKIGNNIEEILDQIDGFLVPNTKWEDAFRKLSEDSNLIRKLELGAEEKATKRNWKNIANHHIKVYEKL